MTRLRESRRRSTPSVPDRRRGTPRIAAAAALAALALAAATGGCGGDEHESRVVEFVVPDGAAARIARGERVAIMPDVLELRVGDTLRIRNEDVVGATVGPYYVEAGREFTLTYGAPGVFTGACDYSEDGTFRIVVRE